MTRKSTGHPLDAARWLATLTASARRCRLSPASAMGTTSGDDRVARAKQESSQKRLEYAHGARGVAKLSPGRPLETHAIESATECRSSGATSANSNCASSARRPTSHRRRCGGRSAQADVQLHGLDNLARLSAARKRGGRIEAIRGGPWVEPAERLRRELAPCACDD